MRAGTVCRSKIESSTRAIVSGRALVDLPFKAPRRGPQLQTPTAPQAYRPLTLACPSQVAAHMFEAGCIIHSFLLGLTLGVNKDDRSHVGDAWGGGMRCAVPFFMTSAVGCF